MSRISLRSYGGLRRRCSIERSKRSRWSSRRKKLPRQTCTTSYVASERKNPQSRIGTRASATGTNRPSTKAAPSEYTPRSNLAPSIFVPSMSPDTDPVYSRPGVNAPPAARAAGRRGGREPDPSEVQAPPFPEQSPVGELPFVLELGAALLPKVSLDV